VAEPETREVVEALYRAFLAGDGEGMIALMADDVEVTFLGQGRFHGIPAVRRFMQFSAGLLNDVAFDIRALIVDGDVGSAIWRETATTRDGQPWENHGVDVIRVRDGRIVSLHENNDVRLVYRHFPPYEDAEASDAG
jgi:ketosteroid isomerase-like protein